MMKKYFFESVSKSLVVIMGLLAMTFSSCLKEGDSFPKSDDENVAIVELGSAQTPDSYTTSYQAFSLSGEFKNDTVGFYAIIQYNGPTSKAPQDITVNLGTDLSALDTYNDENTTDYVAFDPKMLSYPKTVTIEKGTDRVRIRIVVNDTTGFNFSNTYALPLKIESSSYGTVTANTSTKIYAFTAKNQYDGIYTVTGTFKDANLATATGIYPKTVHLVSIGLNSNIYLDASTSSSKTNYYYFNNSGVTTYYGNFCPIFNFSGDKIVSVTNSFGQGTNASSRYAQIDPNGINSVVFQEDGKTPKTISVSYYLMVGIPGSGAIRTSITEVYTYKSVR